MRFDQCNQCTPRHDLVHLSQETLATYLQSAARLIELYALSNLWLVRPD